MTHSLPRVYVAALWPGHELLGKAVSNNIRERFVLASHSALVAFALRDKKPANDICALAREEHSKTDGLISHDTIAKLLKLSLDDVTQRLAEPSQSKPSQQSLAEPSRAVGTARKKSKGNNINNKASAPPGFLPCNAWKSKEETSSKQRAPPPPTILRGRRSLIDVRARQDWPADGPDLYILLEGFDSVEALQALVVNDISVDAVVVTVSHGTSTKDAVDGNGDDTNAKSATEWQRKIDLLEQLAAQDTPGSTPSLWNILVLDAIPSKATLSAPDADLRFFDQVVKPIYATCRADIERRLIAQSCPPIAVGSLPSASRIPATTYIKTLENIPLQATTAAHVLAAILTHVEQNSVCNAPSGFPAHHSASFSSLSPTHASPSAAVSLVLDATASSLNVHSSTDHADTDDNDLTFISGTDSTALLLARHKQHLHVAPAHILRLHRDLIVRALFARFSLAPAPNERMRHYQLRHFINAQPHSSSSVHNYPHILNALTFEQHLDVPRAMLDSGALYATVYRGSPAALLRRMACAQSTTHPRVLTARSPSLSATLVALHEQPTTETSHSSTMHLATPLQLRNHLRWQQVQSQRVSATRTYDLCDVIVHQRQTESRSVPVGHAANCLLLQSRTSQSQWDSLCSRVSLDTTSDFHAIHRFSLDRRVQSFSTNVAPHSQSPPASLTFSAFLDGTHICACLLSHTLTVSTPDTTTPVRLARDGSLTVLAESHPFVFLPGGLLVQHTPVAITVRDYHGRIFSRDVQTGAESYTDAEGVHRKAWTSDEVAHFRLTRADQLYPSVLERRLEQARQEQFSAVAVATDAVTAAAAAATQTQSTPAPPVVPSATKNRRPRRSTTVSATVQSSSSSTHTVDWTAVERACADEARVEAHRLAEEEPLPETEGKLLQRVVMHVGSQTVVYRVDGTTVVQRDGVAVSAEYSDGVRLSRSGTEYTQLESPTLDCVCTVADDSSVARVHSSANGITVVYTCRASPMVHVEQAPVALSIDFSASSAQLLFPHKDQFTFSCNPLPMCISHTDNVTARDGRIDTKAGTNIDPLAPLLFVVRDDGLGGEEWTSAPPPTSTGSIATSSNTTQLSDDSEAHISFHTLTTPATAVSGRLPSLLPSALRSRDTVEQAASARPQATVVYHEHIQRAPISDAARTHASLAYDKYTDWCKQHAHHQQQQQPQSSGASLDAIGHEIARAAEQFAQVQQMRSERQRQFEAQEAKEQAEVARKRERDAIVRQQDAESCLLRHEKYLVPHYFASPEYTEYTSAPQHVMARLAAAIPSSSTTSVGRTPLPPIDSPSAPIVGRRELHQHDSEDTFTVA